MSSRLIHSVSLTTAMLAASVAHCEIVVDGFSRPNRVSKVAASNPGVVLEHIVASGATVREGQSLAKIDSEVFSRGLDIARLRSEASAKLTGAQVDLNTAARRLEILQGLADRSHASIDEVDRAETELAKAESRLQEAHEAKRLYAAEYRKLAAQAEQFSVKAPFDGVVIDFAKQKGEWVGQADPHVCTVAELKVLSVDFLIPSHAAESLSADDSVEVQFISSGRVTTGKVSFIAPYPQAETNTIEVRVQIDNKQGEFSAGRRCQITLKSGESTPQHELASTKH